jgi:ribosomal-protein-serine acetyltransferase
MFKLIIDENVELRMIESNDIKRLYELIDGNRERLKEWFDWPDRVKSESDTRDYISFIRKNIGLTGHMHAGIWYNEFLIGIISHQNFKASNASIAIGYWLDKDYEGKGIMTRAVKEMISYAFYIGINKVEIFCAVQNSKSRRIPEKLGFVQEGIIRGAERLNGEYIDDVIYGILKGEWNED